MPTLFLVLAALFLLCNGVRFAYELLKESGRIGEKNTPVFVVVVIAMIVLWTSWFLMGTTEPASGLIPPWLRWLGGLLTAAGTILAVGAFLQLRGVEGIRNLVTTGLFRFSRHPMYLGFRLWLVGWPFLQDAPISLVLGVVGAANILFWRHLEDRRLTRQFGEVYTQYKKHVRV